MKNDNGKINKRKTKMKKTKTDLK
jgi:hypothetical protein